MKKSATTANQKPKQPARTCIGCRAKKNKETLLRIVLRERGTIEIERDAPLPGRGAYVCRKRECAELAKRKRGLDRSFGTTLQENAYDSLIFFISREFPSQQ